LKNRKKIDTKDWKVNINKLKNYSENVWNDDQFYETDNLKYGIYIYNINEYRMCSYNSEFAIFTDKNEEIPTINYEFNSIDFNFKTCFKYLELSDCFIFKKQFYQKEINKLSFPFLIVKPKEKKYTLIEWDFSSIYFELIEMEKDILKLKILFPKEIERLNLEYRENEIFEIEKLKWFEMETLKNSSEIYQNLIMK